MAYNSASAVDSAMAPCVVDHVLKQCLPLIAAPPNVDFRDLLTPLQSAPVITFSWVASSTDCQGNRHTTRFPPARNRTTFFSLLQLAVVGLAFSEDRTSPLLKIEHLENPEPHSSTSRLLHGTLWPHRGTLQCLFSSPVVDNHSPIAICRKAVALPSNPKRSNKGFRCFSPPPILFSNSSISRISRATLRPFWSSSSGPKIALTLTNWGRESLRHPLQILVTPAEHKIVAVDHTNKISFSTPGDHRAPDSSSKTCLVHDFSIEVFPRRRRLAESVQPQN